MNNTRSAHQSRQTTKQILHFKLEIELKRYDLPGVAGIALQNKDQIKMRKNKCILKIAI